VAATRFELVTKGLWSR